MKDIANTLHLSQATVSNALAGKTTVNDATRALVLSAATQMGYRANRLAQSLARSPIRIGILLPSFWPQHYGAFEKGIRKELCRLQDYNVSGVFAYVSTQYAGNEITEALDQLLEQNIQAAIVCPGFDAGYRKQLDRLERLGIPTVLLGTDMKDSKRWGCISTDAYAAGALAGEFLRLILQCDQTCMILIGNKDMDEHADKVKGFYTTFSADNRIAGVYETQDVPEVAYLITKKALTERPDLGGIYAATGNSDAVCKCLMEERPAGSVKVVATDVFAGSQKYMEVGIIQGIIYQNQFLQGKLAIKKLFRFLTGEENNPSEVRVYPNLILRSNMPYFRDGYDFAFPDTKETI